jgi:hypothetical protein
MVKNREFDKITFLYTRSNTNIIKLIEVTLL